MFFQYAKYVTTLRKKAFKILVDKINVLILLLDFIIILWQ